MIFKTFNNDIDKWTAKIGIFGKSFNELGTAINNAFKSVIDNFDNFDENVGFWESLKNNLLPKKEDITSQLVDVMPEINTDNLIDATEKIKILSKDVANGTTTWQELFDTLPEGQKHFAQLGQQMKGQIITTEGVAKANQAARDAAIAHNAALKQQTLGAKAATVAMKALSIAGNMLLMWGISKIAEGIEYLTSANERYIESQQEIVDKTKEQIAEYDEEINSLTDLQEKLEDARGNKEKLAELQKDLNKAIGETPGLLNGESDAWSVANQKIIDRIALLEKLREEELQRNIQATKNIYNAQVVDNDWGKDDKIENYFSNTHEDIQAREYYKSKGEEIPSWLKGYNDLVDDYLNQIETEGKSLSEIIATHMQDNMSEGILEHLPTADELETYFNSQYAIIAPLFSDYISNLETVLPNESLNGILKQLVYVNPNDAVAVEKQFKDFINALGSKNIGDIYNEYLKSLQNDGVNSEDLYNQLIDSVNELIELYPYATVELNTFISSIGTNISSVKTTVEQELKSFTEAFNAKTFADSAKALKELAISGQITPEVLTSTKEYRQLLEDTGLTAEEAAEKIREIALGESSLSTIMSEIQSTANLINEVEGNLNDYGEITFSSLQKIAEQFPSLEENIRNYLNGVEGAEEELVNKLKDCYKQDLINYDEYYEAKQGNDETWWKNFLENSSDIVDKLRENYDIDLSNFSTYLLAKEKIESLISDYESKVSQYSVGFASVMPDPLSVGGYYQNKVDELNAYLEEIQNKFKDSIKSPNWEDTLDYTSGNKYSSSSSSEKSFDWISTATKRADEELDTLNDKISDTYATWEERTQALKDAFDRVTNSIELQKQAAEAYMEEANKIDLPEAYKRLVQNGALKVEDITDSDLADKISEYQTLYEKSIECTKTAEELQTTLNEIATSKQWDLIKNQFSASLDEVDFRISEIQNSIDILEMKGLYADEKYYNDMIALTQKKKATLESEMTQLQSIMSNMTPGKESYNKMFSELMDIRTEVSGLEKDIVDFNKTIRDLNWEVFEYLEESINRITDETEYLVGLLENKDLFDKNGNRTNYGDATIGLHAIAYETYKQQAQDYLEEANKLQKELVAGAGKDVLEQYNKMVEAHRDAVNSALDEKNAILDLIEDGYNAQLDALQELIDKKKEQLNAEKNLYDYQKNLKKQSDNISNLEKQQIAYNGDNSEEAMAKAQQLKVQLDDARDELQQTEYEQYLSDTQNMLDTLSTEFETWINERLDNSDMLFEQTIEQISMQGSSITDTLNSIAAENNTMISDSLLGITGSMDNYSFAIQEAIQKNMETTAQLITESNTSLTDSVSNSIGSSLSITNGVISDAAGSIVSAENGTSSSVLQGASSIISAIGSLGSSLSSSIYSMGSTIASSVSGAISGIKADVSKNANNISSLQNSISSLRSSLDALSSRVSSLQSNSNNSGGGNSGSGSGMNRENLSQASRYYASGTSNAKKGLAWTQEDGQEYIITKDGALLTNLSGGELILNNKASKLLYDFANSPEEFLRNMPSFVPNINLPSLDVPNSFREQKVDMKVGDITISLPNVTNYAEFRNELIKDKDFEKSILTTVNNAAMGKSTISKLKYVK